MMATDIQPNRGVGQRMDRAANVKRLRNILNDLQTAYDTWDTLTAADRNAATKKMLRAVIALMRFQINEIKDSSS